MQAIWTLWTMVSIISICLDFMKLVQTQWVLSIYSTSTKIGPKLCILLIHKYVLIFSDTHLWKGIILASCFSNLYHIILSLCICSRYHLVGLCHYTLIPMLSPGPFLLFPVVLCTTVRCQSELHAFIDFWFNPFIRNGIRINCKCKRNKKLDFFLTL